MARSVLASEMLTRLRDATGTSNDGHITTAEGYRALTSAVAETWDFILACGIGTEAVAKASFSSVAGTSEYALTTIAADFYQLRNLYVLESDGALRPLSRVNPSELYCLRAPTSVCSMKLYYFPAAPVFTLGTETFDGINGWEEHVIQTAAIFIKAKKEDDTGQYRARKREIEARMATMANRLQDEPPRIVRRKQIYRGYAIPYSTGVRYYDIRGANLELYS